MKTPKQKTLGTLLAMILLLSFSSIATTTYADSDERDSEYESDAGDYDNDEDSEYESDDEDYDSNEDSDSYSENEAGDDDQYENNDYGQDNVSDTDNGQTYQDTNTALTQKDTYKIFIQDKYGDKIRAFDNTKSQGIVDRIDVILGELNVDTVLNENKIIILEALREILVEQINDDILNIESLLQ